jgi:hypothetical protein
MMAYYEVAHLAQKRVEMTVEMTVVQLDILLVSKLVALMGDWTAEQKADMSVDRTAG